MGDTAVHVLALCLALASVETLHGIERAALLVPRVGKKAALKISIVSESALALALCWAFVPRMGLRQPQELLALGRHATVLMDKRTGDCRFASENLGPGLC